MSNSKFSRRKFVSAGLLFTLVILMFTAIVIQIFEAINDDFFIHFFTVIHIFTGLTFTVLSVIHMVLNWRAMRNYLQLKLGLGNREVFWACFLTIGAVLIGFLFVCFIMD